MGVQKPLALTSDLAPGPLMVDFKSNVSPVMGINAGSIATSLHTFFSFLANRLRRWSCLPIVNPACGQRRAWLASNDSQQTHLVARSGMGQPYLKARLSLKHCLLSMRSCSSRGMDVSHDEAPYFKNLYY